MTAPVPTSPTQIMREAAHKIRVDVKVAVDRGHMSDRQGRFQRAVADVLEQQADMYEAHPQTWPVKKSVAVALNYLDGISP